MDWIGGSSRESEKVKYTFSQGPLAKQGDLVKEPQFSRERWGPQNVEEVALPILRPGWRQVLFSCTVHSNGEKSQTYHCQTQSKHIEDKAKKVEIKTTF